MTPGSMPLAREIFQEGLVLPPVRLVRRGRIVDDVLGIVLANVRTPAESEGDLTAQIAANRVGEARLREAVARYGARKVSTYARAAQDYTERVLRHTIRGIPDGEYRFEDALDDEGFGHGPMRIRAAVRNDGDRAEVDFTGSDPQTEGGVNANFAITLSATLYAFRCLVRGAFLYLEPFVTLIVASIVIRESILLVSIIGGMTILVGVWLVSRPSKWAQVVEEPT